MNVALFTHSATLRLIFFLMLTLSSFVSFAADKPSAIKGGNGIEFPPPPATAVQPVTENIHGTPITDPYRWLEDGKAPATRAWIDEQMKYTEQYLSQVKIRPAISSVSLRSWNGSKATASQPSMAEITFSRSGCLTRIRDPSTCGAACMARMSD